MSDKKISQLPASTTPLAGSEELPVVQSGVTKKVSVANLTAGRNITASKVGAGVASPSYAIDASADNDQIIARFTNVNATTTSRVYVVCGTATSILQQFGQSNATYPNATAFNSPGTLYLNYSGQSTPSGAVFSSSTSSVNSQAFDFKNDGTGTKTIRVFPNATTPAFGTTTNHSLNVITNNTIRSTFDTSGNFSVANGNLVIGTDGKGIDFSATPGTGTSELLDDYEEGTFTATLTATTTAPTTPVTATAYYTKIGRQVNIIGTFENVSTVGADGNILVTGLPYTYTTAAGITVVGAVSTFALANNSTTKPVVQLLNGATQFSLREVAAGTAVPIIATTGTYLFFNFTYFV